MGQYQNQQETAKVKQPVWPLLLWTDRLQEGILLLLSIPYNVIYLQPLISYSRLRHSIVSTFLNFCLRSQSQVLVTCSIHGEKQHILPSKIYQSVRFLRIYLAWWMAAQGLGTSRNSASALKCIPYIPNPSLTTSLQVEVTLVLFKFSKNYLVIYALSLLNQNVYSLPCYPKVSENAHDNDPLPVPASTTICPGSIFSFNRIAELSIEYRICVFLASVSVINVDLGCKAYTCWFDLLNAPILFPQG